MPRIDASSVPEHRAMVWSRILDAFGNAVAEQGYAAVSLAVVAQRAGIARNSVYTYVPDKSALLLAHIDRSVSRFLAGTRDAAGTDSTPAERLTHLVRSHLERMVEPVDGDESEALLENVAGSLAPDLRVAVRERFHPVVSVVTDILREGQATGEFRPLPDVARTVDLIVGVMVAAREALQGAESPDIVVDESVEFVRRAVLADRSRADRPRAEG